MGIVLLSALAYAESDLASETPGETSAAINAPAPAAMIAVKLPDAPTTSKAKPDGRTIDKKFIFVMGALAGAESLRFSTHTLVLDHEFAEGAPWVASTPKNKHLVASYGAIFAAEVVVAYALKKPHHWLPGDKVIRKMWWVYPAVMTPIHIKNGVGSIRTTGPSGCTSEAQCEAEQMQ